MPRPRPDVAPQVSSRTLAMLLFNQGAHGCAALRADKAGRVINSSMPLYDIAAIALTGLGATARSVRAAEASGRPDFLAEAFAATTNAVLRESFLGARHEGRSFLEMVLGTDAARRGESLDAARVLEAMAPRAGGDAWAARARGGGADSDVGDDADGDAYARAIVLARFGDGGEALEALKARCGTAPPPRGGAFGGDDACVVALARAAADAFVFAIDQELVRAVLAPLAPFTTPPPPKALAWARRAAAALRTLRHALRKLGETPARRRIVARLKHTTADWQTWLLNDRFDDAHDPVTIADGAETPAAEDEAEAEAPPRPAAATTGLFVLRGATRAYVTDAAAGPALGLVVRATWVEFPELRSTFALHVLVTYPALGSVAAETASWKRALGEATPALRGVEEVLAAPFPVRALQGNYLRKIYAMWRTASRDGYSHVASIDEDVLLSPAALHALLVRLPRRDMRGVEGDFDDVGEAPDVDGDSCGIVTPTLSTGVPTIELFAADYLTVDEATALNACLADAFPDDAPAAAARTWEPAAFYAFIENVSRALLVPPLTNVAGGHHPVRVGCKCAALVTAWCAARVVPAHFGPWRRGDALRDPPRLEATRRFPYLANSVWVATVGTLTRLLAMDEVFFAWSNPYDEGALNVLLRASGAPLCILHAPALHPHYNHCVDEDVAAAGLHDAAREALLRRLDDVALRGTARPPKHDAGRPARSERARPAVPTPADEWPRHEGARCAGDDLPAAAAFAAADSGDLAAAPLHVFVHVALLEGWQPILGEMLSAVNASSLAGALETLDVVVVGGDVGGDAARGAVEALAWRCSSAALRSKSAVTISAWPIVAYELSTLSVVHARAQDMEPGALVLYLHTKGVGAGIRDPAYADWLRFMVHFTVERWCACAVRLDARLHVADTLRATCGVDLRLDPAPHYSGNVWWARADHVAALVSPLRFADELAHRNALGSWRHNLEFWLLSSFRDAEAAERAAANLWRWDGPTYYRRLAPPFPRAAYADDAPSCACPDVTRAGAHVTVHGVSVARDASEQTLVGVARDFVAAGAAYEGDLPLAHCAPQVLDGDSCGAGGADAAQRTAVGIRNYVATALGRRHVETPVSARRRDARVAIRAHHHEGSFTTELVGLSGVYSNGSLAFAWEREPSDSAADDAAGLTAALRAACVAAPRGLDGADAEACGHLIADATAALASLCRMHSRIALLDGDTREGGSCLDGTDDAGVVWLDADARWVGYRTAAEGEALVRALDAAAPRRGGGRLESWYVDARGACKTRSERDAMTAVDYGLARALPSLFAGVASARDVGGGLGAYLAGGLRAAGVRSLTTVEPYLPQRCALAGVNVDHAEDFGAGGAADLVVSIEVGEHVPLARRAEFVGAIANQTRRWLLFSAALPGAPSPVSTDGHIWARHVACSTPRRWRAMFEANTPLRFDKAKTDAARRTTLYHKYLRTNLMVFSRSP
ncbi:hypothetical protein M885DRAFT_510065 [Pelagophyceae sp. CCMP2097]|nr:hypothetical protein M885DRAFT_510065 [Pelagophyceae sp. CCMP2097]